MHPNVKYPALYDRAWLEAQYVGSERTARDIAAEVGCTPTAVQRALHLQNIPVRDRYREPPAFKGGEVLGRLTVVAFAGMSRIGTQGATQRTYLCRCECGTEKVIASRNLTCGGTNSCGCLARESQHRVTHGHHTGGKLSPTLSSYMNAKARVTYPSCPSYDRYGGRGITMCARWLASFEAFLADMGERPADRSLDRIDPDGDYEPGNCRWATTGEQNANRLCRDLDGAAAVERAVQILQQYAPDLLE